MKSNAEIREFLDSEAIGNVNQRYNQAKSDRKAKPRTADYQFEIICALFARKFRDELQQFVNKDLSRADSRSMRQLCIYYLDVTINRLALNEEKAVLILESQRLLAWLKAVKKAQGLTAAELAEYQRLNSSYRRCRAVGLYNQGKASLEHADEAGISLAVRVELIGGAIKKWELSLKYYTRLREAADCLQVERGLATNYETLGDENSELATSGDFDPAFCAAALAAYAKAKDYYSTFAKADRAGGWLVKRRDVVLSMLNLYQQQLHHIKPTIATNHAACLAIVRNVDTLSKGLGRGAALDTSHYLELLETRFCCLRVAVSIYRQQENKVFAEQSQIRLRSVAQGFVMRLEESGVDYAIDAGLKAEIIMLGKRHSKSRTKRTIAESDSTSRRKRPQSAKKKSKDQQSVVAQADPRRRGGMVERDHHSVFLGPQLASQSAIAALVAKREAMVRAKPRPRPASAVPATAAVSVGGGGAVAPHSAVSHQAKAAVKAPKPLSVATSVSGYRFMAVARATPQSAASSATASTGTGTLAHAGVFARAGHVRTPAPAVSLEAFRAYFNSDGFTNDCGNDPRVITHISERLLLAFIAACMQESAWIHTSTLPEICSSALASKGLYACSPECMALQLSGLNKQYRLGLKITSHTGTSYTTLAEFFETILDEIETLALTKPENTARLLQKTLYNFSAKPFSPRTHDVFHKSFTRVEEALTARPATIAADAFNWRR